MNQREKIMVYGGLALVALTVGWKVLRSGGAGLADSSTIDGAIYRIEAGERLRAEVDTMAREMALAIPQVTPSEQESAIRDDLARKARECELIAISLKGIESTQRGAVRQVAQVQYRMELYGAYDAFMKMVTLLEKSPVPYVIKEISFESSPRPPAGVANEQGGGGQGGPGGGDQQTLPNGMTLAQLPPEMRDKAERMMRQREGRGGEGKNTQANGKVHATMRVQSFLFPAEAVGVRAAAAGVAGTARTEQRPLAGEHKGAENPALHKMGESRATSGTHEAPVKQ